MQKPFKVTARVLAHLGEDLIKDESIALLELVKNSYDAGASICNVDFLFDNNDGELNQITISDNGCGMSLDIVENVWLVIGTDNKKHIIENKKSGRLPLGEKGIGRLGVHKLGNDIQLYSKAINQQEVFVHIDWTKLSTSNEIDDFQIDYGYSEAPRFLSDENGTIIIIRNIKGEWNRRKLRSVYRDLTTLNSPFNNNNSDSFIVNVSSNNNVFSGLPNMEAIMNAGLYYGHCTIEGNRITHFNYEFKPWTGLEKISSRKVNELDQYESLLVHKVESDKDGKKTTYNEEFFSLADYNIGKIEFDIIMYEKDSAVFNLLNIEKTGLNNYLRENVTIQRMV